MRRRGPALVVIVGLLVAAVVLDQRQAARARRQAIETGALGGPGDLARLGPSGAPAGALDSAWHCAGGTAEEDGMANQTVVVANPTARPLRGRITVVPSVGEPVTRLLEVGAHRRTDLPLAEVVTAPYASATVEVEGGGAVVDHVVAGPTGYDLAPCASTASATWSFAAGATTRDARAVLVLYNPFPDPAVADLSFLTDEGRRVPGAFRGIPVAGRSVVAMDVTEQVTVRPQIASFVTTRQGRLVVDLLQSYDGTGASTTEEEAEAEAYRPRGLTLLPGVPEARPTWALPYGTKVEGVHERIAVVNPSRERAQVEVVVGLDDPARNGEVDPFRIDLDGGSFQVLDLDEEVRVPDRMGHAAVVHSLTGTPIVVAKLVATSEGFSSLDTTATPGSPVASTEWVLAAGASDERVEQRVAIQNTGTRPATVRIQHFGDGQRRDVPELGRIELAPGEHRRVSLRDLVDAARISLLVTADQPVVVQRWVVRPDEDGHGGALGVPLAPGLAPVPPPPG